MTNYCGCGVFVYYYSSLCFDIDFLENIFKVKGQK